MNADSTDPPLRLPKPSFAVKSNSRSFAELLIAKIAELETLAFSVPPCLRGRFGFLDHPITR